MQFKSSDLKIKFADLLVPEASNDSKDWNNDDSCHGIFHGTYTIFSNREYIFSDFSFICNKCPV